MSFVWCLVHRRVENDEGRCPAKDVLGPYETREEAEHTLATVADRNEVWDEEDERRDGDGDADGD